VRKKSGFPNVRNCQHLKFAINASRPDTHSDRMKEFKLNKSTAKRVRTRILLCLAAVSLAATTLRAQAPTITEYPLPTAHSLPLYITPEGGITLGPDGALWFPVSGEPFNIGRMTTAGVVTMFPLPTSNIASSP